MIDVFLSYSKKDFDAAANVIQALEAAGYSVFWRRDVPRNSNWNASIGPYLLESQACVVLWSNASYQSRNVAYEVDVARRKDKLIEVKIENLSEASRKLKHAIDLQDFNGGEHPGVSDLINAIRMVAGDRTRRSSADPRPVLIKPREPLHLPSRSAGAPLAAPTAELRSPSDYRRAARRELRSMGIKHHRVASGDDKRAAAGSLALTALAGCLTGYILMSEPQGSDQAASLNAGYTELAANGPLAVIK